MSDLISSWQESLFHKTFGVLTLYANSQSRFIFFVRVHIISWWQKETHEELWAGTCGPAAIRRSYEENRHVVVKHGNWQVWNPGYALLASRNASRSASGMPQGKGVEEHEFMAIPFSATVGPWIMVGVEKVTWGGHLGFCNLSAWCIRIFSKKWRQILVIKTYSQYLQDKKILQYIKDPHLHS